MVAITVYHIFLLSGRIYYRIFYLLDIIIKIYIVEIIEIIENWVQFKKLNQFSIHFEIILLTFQVQIVSVWLLSRQINFL